jgi:hypothetical protein
MFVQKYLLTSNVGWELNLTEEEQKDISIVQQKISEYKSLHINPILSSKYAHRWTEVLINHPRSASRTYDYQILNNHLYRTITWPDRKSYDDVAHFFIEVKENFILENGYFPYNAELIEEYIA